MSVSYEELFETLKYEVDNLAKMLLNNNYHEAVSDGYHILAELRNRIGARC
jgi:hypothetical protein